MNPYESPRHASQPEATLPNERSNRPMAISIFVAIAYALHALALWAIICFHDASSASSLRDPFAMISAIFGPLGLLAVAAIYAIVPGLLNLGALLIASRMIKNDARFIQIFNVFGVLLGGTLAIAVMLGIPLFTTG